MNRKNFFTALACGLLMFSLLGCGVSNNLKSVQLSTSNTNPAPPGTLDLKGIGGTQQVYAWGNYSSGKQLLLDNRNVTFHLAVDPSSPDAVQCCGIGAGSLYPLAAPPQTMQISTTGLLTAVDPSACSFYNSAAGTASKNPAWSMVGAYIVTATYSGLTSPPVFVAIASAPGVFDPINNTSGACGP